MSYGHYDGPISSRMRVIMHNINMPQQQPAQKVCKWSLTYGGDNKSDALPRSYPLFYRFTSLVHHKVIFFYIFYYPLREIGAASPGGSASPLVQRHPFTACVYSCFQPTGHFGLLFFERWNWDLYRAHLMVRACVCTRAETGTVSESAHDFDSI